MKLGGYVDDTIGHLSLLCQEIPIVEYFGKFTHLNICMSDFAWNFFYAGQRDYLSVMATLVSSKHVFSSVGITISKRHNCLKSEIVEALQCDKCLLQCDLLFHEDPSVLADTEGDNSEVRVPDTKSGDDGWDEMIPDLDLLELGSDKVNHGEEIILMGLE